MPGMNGSGILPTGGEGVINIAVNSSHSFSAWKLRNGSWAGFRNGIPGNSLHSTCLVNPPLLQLVLCGSNYGSVAVDAFRG